MGLNNAKALVTNSTSLTGIVNSSLMIASAPSPLTLLQTIYTSQFSPPSPDPSGIVYISHLGSLLISDEFTPTSTGEDTSGTFEMYFDGSDVGLTTDNEELDVIAIDRDGKLVISTKGDFTVLGVSGADEDLIKFNASSLGQNTVGTWTMLFDGSDVGLTNSSEDVNGVWFDPNSNKIFLTTEGAFNVPGASGDGADIFAFTPTSLGVNTSGSFTPYWDGSNNGIPSGIAVEGIAIAPIF